MGRKELVSGLGDWIVVVAFISNVNWICRFDGEDGDSYELSLGSDDLRQSWDVKREMSRVG